VDVHDYAAAIDRMGILPVKLAAEQASRVGDRIFAIGHPGGKGPVVLTSTLSDGIVSAVDRPLDNARFLQVTAPINPGNSGGPVFDSDGRVVGVATFTYRRKAGDGVQLEALNFALQVEYVHELLDKPSASLDKRAIAAIVSPPPAEATDSMKKSLERKLSRLAEEGYKSGESGTPETSVFRLGPGERRALLLDQKGQWAVVTISEGVKDIDLAVLDVVEKKVVTECRESRPDPEVKFKLDKEGLYMVFVRNSMEKPALVSVTMLRK
jgi:hypothetical protein